MKDHENESDGIMTIVPYNQHCRIETPTYEKEGILRPGLQLHQNVHFLYFSGGRPYLQIYDMNQMVQGSEVAGVTFYKSPDNHTAFPLYGLEAVVARCRLWLAGVKGPNSVRKQVEDDQGLRNLSTEPRESS